MTGVDHDTASGRRARIETDHGDGETARRLARALRPDNTTEMDTHVEGARLVTTIERGHAGSLQSTVDDYVVNLRTGAAVLGGGAATDGDRTRNHNTDIDGDTSSQNTSDTRHGDRQ